VLVVRFGLRNIWLAMALGLALCVAMYGMAQPPAAAPASPALQATETPAPQPVPAETKHAAGPALEASQLDTFLLRDSKGNLVPVLGISFEEFEQLLKLKKGLAPPAPPGFTLDSLSIAGTAADGIADLQMTFTLRVRDEGWVRVPLAMKTAVLREVPKYEGPGEHFVAFDETHGGYQAWLRGTGTKPHVLTLHAACNLETTGDETRLVLPLPRATESTLRITVPQQRLEALLSEGNGIAKVESKGAEKSEITVVGAAGELQLGWRKMLEAAGSGPILLDSSGEIVVKVESESRITSDARLRVRSLGAPLSTFQVRLPAGMELVPASPVGYTISTVAASGGEGTKAPFPVVEIHLDRPTSATAEVRLLATTPAAGGGVANLAPARFEVVNAVRQRGTIDFSVEGEWQLSWNNDPTAQRLDISADAAAAKLAARFEYSRQPCNLTLRVAPRPSRVSVEPLHVVDVEPRQIRIATSLKYRLRGSRATGLTFHLGQLQFDRLSPDDLLDAPEPIGSDGVLHVPFRQGVVLPPEIDLKLETHHVLNGDGDQFQVVLPRPVADSVAPATVVVTPADNIELTPQTSVLQGLSPDAAPPPPGLQRRQQQPLVYRDLGGNEPAQFAGLLKVKEGSTVVSAAAMVRMDKQQLQIEQRLSYRISHEAKRSFVVVAPHGPVAAGGLSVMSGDSALEVELLSDAPAKSVSLQRWQFSTPGDQIGTFPVVIRYAVPFPRWDGQKPLPVTIPLVLPEDAPNYQFGGQEITFAIDGGLQVEPELTGVDEFSRPTASDKNGAVFTWSKAATTTRWIVQPLRDAPATPIVCDKVWIQTWLTPDLRQERVAVRLTSSADGLRVRLPAGVVLSSVQAAINAQAVPVNLRAPSFVRIEFPPALRGRSCVLEIWYSLPPPQRRGGLLATELQPAVVEEATPPRRSYWQLVLGANDQFVASPAGMAPEMIWNGTSWYSGPQPLLDQSQLEAWIESSRQDALPAGVNAYLFGTLTQSPKLHIVVASRRLVLIGASGFALALGLLFIHVPAARRSTPLLLAAVGLGALSLAWPDAALLLGRAALLGLAVAFAIGAWRWLAWGLPLPAAEFSSTTTGLAGSGPASTATPRPGSLLPLSTATAPATMASGEGQP
jgi:hypothetical protein